MKAHHQLVASEREREREGEGAPPHTQPDVRNVASQPSNRQPHQIKCIGQLQAGFGSFKWAWLLLSSSDNNQSTLTSFDVL